MLIKEIYERIPRDEVILSKKFYLRKFSLMDVATNRNDVFVQNFCDLFDGIEGEIDSHFSPMNFLILYRVLPWGFSVLPLRISATAEWDILRNMPTCLSVRSLSRMNSLNLPIILDTSGFCMINSTLMQKYMYVKHFFQVCSIFNL